MLSSCTVQDRCPPACEKSANFQQVKIYTLGIYILTNLLCCSEYSKAPTFSFKMRGYNVRVLVPCFLRLMFFLHNGLILTFHMTVLYHCASIGGMIGTGMCTIYTVQALSTRSPPTRIRRLSSARTDTPSVRQYLTRSITSWEVI